MKRSIIAALAGVSWLAATASAAALTYTLHGPPMPPAAPVEGRSNEVPVLEVSENATSEVGEIRAPTVLQVPVVRIVARTSVPRVAPVPRPIREMKCADWRDLDMGSGRVQICE
jgi:hypothetical protein